MHTFSIGTENQAEALIERLQEEFRYLHGEGVDVETTLADRGKLTFLECRVEPGSDAAAATVEHYLASALSDVILADCASHQVRRIIRSQYHYFSREEQERIFEFAQRHLQEDSREHRQQVSRRAQVLHRLRDFLEQQHELVLEGFVTFRLRDYIEELEDAVDQAVDDFLLEREHKEFIRLLRYFVEVQEPRTVLVNVLMSHGGSFKLVDAEGNSLQSDILEEFVGEMVDASEVNYDDLLISALITVSPRRVILHGTPPPGWEEAIQTIHGVFLERVDACAGCLLCQTHAALTAAEAGDAAPILG